MSGVQEAAMPHQKLLCTVCGHPREMHGQPRQTLMSAEFIPGYQKAVSECPGYDPGNDDEALRRIQDEAVSDEQGVLDELRLGAGLGSHYD
jgi:hypothetical protein